MGNIVVISVRTRIMNFTDKLFIKRTDFIGKGDFAFRAVQLQIPGIDLM